MSDDLVDLFGDVITVGGVEYLTTRQAAQMAEVSASRVRQLAQEGRFPGATRFGRDWALPVDSVRDWLQLYRDMRYDVYKKNKGKG